MSKKLKSESTDEVTAAYTSYEKIVNGVPIIPVAINPNHRKFSSPDELRVWWEVQGPESELAVTIVKRAYALRNGCEMPEGFLWRKHLSDHLMRRWWNDDVQECDFGEAGSIVFVKVPVCAPFHIAGVLKGVAETLRDRTAGAEQ